MPAAFAEFALSLHRDGFPEPAREVLRKSLVDTLGIGAIGARSAMAHRAKKAAPHVFGHGGPEGADARILFDGTKISSAGAAMAGAFAIDAIDGHDGNAWCKGHAGSAVFPALIAMADAERAAGRPIDGETFMRLVAIAYETSYRAGWAQHETCPDYHTSGSWTAVGVAIAGALLLGARDVDTIRHAAGIGEFHGPRSQMMRCIDFPSNLRDGVGWGAPTGVAAAHLALAGFTGSPALTCESDEAARFWDDLGQGWRIVDQTNYKAFPVCRWAHPALEAARTLMREHGVGHEDIAAITVTTFHNAIRLAGHAPKNIDEFTYAIAYPLATMIVRGEIGERELEPEILEDPLIRRLSLAVTLRETDHYTAISNGRRWADVAFHLKDGRVLQSEPHQPRGEPEAMLTDREISDKFHRFADGPLGRERADRLERLCRDVERLDETAFGELLDVVAAPITAAGEIGAAA